MNTRHLSRIAFPLSSAIAMAFGPAVAQRSVAASESPAEYPGTSWKRITNADSAGWAQQDLDSARARLARLGTTGFMAVVDGRVLLEYGDVRTLSYLASARKSVLSMLFGTYVANGTVRLDKTLAQIGIDDIGGLTPREREATIRDLLTARSGVYHPASNPGWRPGARVKRRERLAREHSTPRSVSRPPSEPSTWARTPSASQSYSGRSSCASPRKMVGW